MKTRKISAYMLVSLLLLAGLGLLAGLYTGIARLGLPLGGHQLVSPILHGPIMINGFLATLISLERAAALEKPWAYGAPFTFATSTLLLLFGFTFIAKPLFIVGSLFLFIIMVFLYYLHTVMHHLIMIIGACCLLLGNLLFLLDEPIFNLVAWWAGFLMLTIFAERLELNRIMRPSESASNFFFGFVILWMVGAALTYTDRIFGWSIASIALIAQALWLFRYDVARRTIKTEGWTRYSAFSLLTGYVWLIAAGFFGLWHGLPYAGLPYDAQLHMIFVGFVFSMIFAHASVIIPSLSGKTIPWHPYFYLPLTLLHGFLIVRICGDIAQLSEVRQIGGHGNVLAILLFLVGIVYKLGRQSFNSNSQTARIDEYV